MRFAMGEVIPFEFGDLPVRVVMLDGKPWLVAADICAGLEILDTRQAVERLDPEDRCQIPVLDARNVQQSMWAINESGLYDLIIRSDKPAARPFRRWITTEVLPRIRQTGSYLPVDLDPDLQRIQDLTLGLQRTRDEARATRDIVDRLDQVTEQQGKALAAVASDVAELKTISPLTVVTNLLTIRDAAQACGTGRTRFMKWLEYEGIVFYDQQGGHRAKQHPWIENGWAVSRFEIWENHHGWSWVTYFTPSGVVQLKRLFSAERDTT